MRDEAIVAYEQRIEWEREAYLARQRSHRKAREVHRKRRQNACLSVLIAALVFMIVWLVYLPVESKEVESAPTETEAGGVLIQSVYEESFSAPVALPEAEEETEVVRPLTYLGEFRVTHYCACVECCGKSEDDPWYGITATGTVATEGRTIAVDPDVIPYGSCVAIHYEDGRIVEYVAEDCGGAVDGLEVDVFVADHDQANRLGVKSGSVYIVSEG